MTPTAFSTLQPAAEFCASQKLFLHYQKPCCFAQHRCLRDPMSLVTRMVQSVSAFLSVSEISKRFGLMATKTQKPLGGLGAGSATFYMVHVVLLPSPPPPCSLFRFSSFTIPLTLHHLLVPLNHSVLLVLSSLLLQSTLIPSPSSRYRSWRGWGT